MKRKTVSLLLTIALLFLTACGSVRNTHAGSGGQNTAPLADDRNAAQPETAGPVTTPGRQDGERFEAVIMLEGMEETVRYEHVRSIAFGFEMDYDCERFVRQRFATCERFVSVWDDPENPENYLEVTGSAKDAEAAAASVREALSQAYDLYEESRELDRAGSCIYMEASELKGTGQMADELQAVYIIPASDGCIVATAHFSLEAAEGFGRRFAYMLNTLSVIDRSSNGTLSDEQALSAIIQYCYTGNPDLEDIVNAEEYPVYWEIASSDEHEIVVLFRSYTGAQIRYYIDRASGEAYVTEFVPGISTEEERTDERFNVRNYLSY